MVEVLVEELYGAKKAGQPRSLLRYPLELLAEGQTRAEQETRKKNQLERNAYVVGRLGNVGEGGDRHFGGLGERNSR